MAIMQNGQSCKIRIIITRKPKLIAKTSVLEWLKRNTFKAKEEEDKWGVSLMRETCPDLGFKNQWTTKFGELIVYELLARYGSVYKPVKKSHFQPDWETDDFIYEVKTQTYNTTGTAGEKIAGVAFKYSDIPELYGKPLKVVLVGGAEFEGRHKYGTLAGHVTSIKQRRFLAYYKESGIEFIGATQLIPPIPPNPP